jgi:hypothetical protein
VPLTCEDVDLACDAVLLHLQRPHTRMAKWGPLFFGSCNVLNLGIGNRTHVGCGCVHASPSHDGTLPHCVDCPNPSRLHWCRTDELWCACCRALLRTVHL